MAPVHSRHHIFLGIALVAIVLVGSFVWGVRRPAPLDDVTDSWTETTSGGVTFSYPVTLGTTYIQTVDWPPVVQIADESYRCTEAGDVTDRAGRTEERSIEGRMYCVTEVVGAAAGSRYTQYAYATSWQEKTAILTFSLRAPQCENYDELQMNECKSERETFKLDYVVERILATMR